MQLPERVAASPSKSLLAVLAAFVLGVAVHAWDERVWAAWGSWAGAAVACAVAAACTHGRPVARSGFVCIAAAFLALARYDAALAGMRAAPPADGRWHGVVDIAPRRQGKAVIVAAKDVVAPDGSRLPRLTLVSRDMAAVADGDAVAWRCFASKTPHAACLVAGRIEATPSGPHPLALLRARLRESVRGLIPEPDASLLLGLLIGDRDGLPKDLVAAFRDTGTSHVLAASGYNVTLVAEAAIVLFALCGLARRRAAAAVSACVVGFALLCGGDPPVMRAAIMGCVGMLAAALGRRHNALNALALAAALMLACDPTALRHDAGFRLSFAAVAGLGAFGRPFAKRLARVPWDGARQALAETLGATVATLPLVLHDFGVLALGAPLVNVLVVPLVPAAMATGAAALAASTPSAVLAAPFAFAAEVPLALLRGAVTTGAVVFPALTARAGIVAAAVMYAWIALLWYALRRADAAKEDAL